MTTNTQTPHHQQDRMIALIVVISIVVLAATATLVDVSRDGYGRTPTRYAR